MAMNLVAMAKIVDTHTNTHTQRVQVKQQQNGKERKKERDNCVSKCSKAFVISTQYERTHRMTHAIQHLQYSKQSYLWQLVLLMSGFNIQGALSDTPIKVNFFLYFY